MQLELTTKDSKAFWYKIINITFVCQKQYIWNKIK